MKTFHTFSTAIACLVLSGTALAGHGNDRVDYAKVTAVQPIYRTVSHRVPREQCWVETVAHERAGPGYDSKTPTIVGGLIGAAVGHRLGHEKRNKQVGAVAGAVLGASIGRDIGARKRPTVTEYRDVERCETRYHTEREERLVGYNVTYRYHGQLYRTRTDHHPGKRIRVAVSVRPAH